MHNLPVKGFLETSFLDWPGQVASVLFLGRCNFRCPFCHNYGLVLNSEDFPTLSWDDLRGRLRKFAGWIDGVVITGGEPTLTPELPELIDDIRGMGFKVKLDSNGSRPEVLEALLKAGLLDHVAMDVKGPLDEVSYLRTCGRPGFLAPVVSSLELLRKSGIPYTLRTTVVPSLHSKKDLMIMGGQLNFAPEWKIQNFCPDNALDEGLREIQPFSAEEFAGLSRLAAMAHGGSAVPNSDAPPKCPVTYEGRARAATGY